MFDAFAPSLERMQPIADRFTKSISAEEVDAVIRLIDVLPELVDRTIEDVLPIVATLQSVAPDIHDMLDTIQELNEMIAKLPGMGRIRKRVEEKQAAEAEAEEAHADETEQKQASQADETHQDNPPGALG
jgi:uncharacterized protein YoxC